MRVSEQILTLWALERCKAIAAFEARVREIEAERKNEEEPLVNALLRGQQSRALPPISNRGALPYGSVYPKSNRND